MYTILEAHQLTIGWGKTVQSNKFTEGYKVTKLILNLSTKKKIENVYSKLWVWS